MVSGEIGDVWQLFDVFAHPTRFDSLPLVVMEAMALRIPSVVTEIGGIPEVVDHEKTGLVVPSREPSRMAESILHLLRNRSEADRLAQAATDRYRQSLSPEQMARNIEQIIARAAGREPEVGTIRGAA